MFPEDAGTCFADSTYIEYKTNEDFLSLIWALSSGVQSALIFIFILSLILDIFK